MKAVRWGLIAVAMLGMAVLPAAGQSKSQAAFDKLKALAGEWVGTTGEGKPVAITYRVVSAGSVLEETMQVSAEETMITIYHLDGDRLMVTHYCAVGNQPRMVTTPDPKNPNVFAFKNLDATNLSSPDAGHMRNLVLTLVGDDHLTQQWTFHEKGKDQHTEVFKFSRKK